MPKRGVVVLDGDGPGKLGAGTSPRRASDQVTWVGRIESYQRQARVRSGAMQNGLRAASNPQSRIAAGDDVVAALCLMVSGGWPFRVELAHQSQDLPSASTRA